MNGAIAEPCVAISSAPNNAIVIIIGASQNFLRTRKKDQNSTTKLPIRSLSNCPHRSKASAAPEARFLGTEIYTVSEDPSIADETEVPLMSIGDKPLLMLTQNCRLILGAPPSGGSRFIQ